MQCSKRCRLAVDIKRYLIADTTKNKDPYAFSWGLVFYHLQLKVEEEKWICQMCWLVGCCRNWVSFCFLLDLSCGVVQSFVWSDKSRHWFMTYGRCSKIKSTIYIWNIWMSSSWRKHERWENKGFIRKIWRLYSEHMKYLSFHPLLVRLLVIHDFVFHFILNYLFF